MSSAVFVQMKRVLAICSSLRLTDREHEVADGAEGAAMDCLAFDDSEPDLDEVQP
jgi:hypothetical protein